MARSTHERKVNWRRTGLVLGGVALLSVASGGIDVDDEWDYDGRPVQLAAHDIEAISGIVGSFAGSEAAAEVHDELMTEFGHDEDERHPVAVRLSEAERAEIEALRRSADALREELAAEFSHEIREDMRREIRRSLGS